GATVIAVPQEVPETGADAPGGGAAGARFPKALWLLMIAAALTQGCHGALNAFASIHWRALGFSDATIGYFWAAGVIAEILIFMLLGRAVGRGTGAGLILVGAAAAIIRFTAMSL